jgi:hypothetical protein
MDGAKQGCNCWAFGNEPTKQKVRLKAHRKLALTESRIKEGWTVPTGSTRLGNQASRSESALNDL